MSPEAEALPSNLPTSSSPPPDRTLVVFHLRQGDGPNSDSVIRLSTPRSSAEILVMLTSGDYVTPDNEFYSVGAGERIVLIAKRHVAWIDIKPLSDREHRRLREQLDLEGVPC